MPTIIVNDPLATLRNCGGYYECPKEPDGKRLGPLVGYAGKYGLDGEHFVGDVYYNFARAEQYPAVRDHFARQMENRFPFSGVDVFLGSPMGGILLAGDLGRVTSGTRVIFAEKKIISLANGGQREESILVIDRHEIWPGDLVVIVEDVCNNFSTTDQLIRLVEELGGKVIEVVCFLNRSPHDVVPGVGVIIRVLSLLHIETVQYQQDNPAVVDDIQAGNVVWKPKRDWERLSAAMKAAEPQPI
ncbi:MAG: hypothetical protein HY093_02655 [Candidatus Liptonbacteria bacterium]|nr:hypothetical protein [Candidatus Liptonbacteria bacterium]